jgi:hypothetical protein
MSPVATSDAAFRGGACPTPEYTIAYTGNYTTSADASAASSVTFERVHGHRKHLGAFFGVEGTPLGRIVEQLAKLVE